LPKCLSSPQQAVSRDTPKLIVAARWVKTSNLMTAEAAAAEETAAAAETAGQRQRQRQRQQQQRHTTCAKS
jgi:hypothetical protein